MAVAKVTEITASSPKGFEDAIQAGITRASKTLQQIRGAHLHLSGVNGLIDATRRAHAVMNDLVRTLGLPAMSPSLHGFLGGTQQRHLAAIPAAGDVVSLLGKEDSAHA